MFSIFTLFSNCRLTNDLGVVLGQNPVDALCHVNCEYVLEKKWFGNEIKVESMEKEEVAGARKSFQNLLQNEIDTKFQKRIDMC